MRSNVLAEASVLPNIPGVWGSLTPWGLLLIVIALIILGVLIPRATHLRELNLVKESRDEWKTAAEEQKEVNKEIRDQNTGLVKALGAAEHFFHEVRPNQIQDTMPSPPKET